MRPSPNPAAIAEREAIAEHVAAFLRGKDKDGKPNMPKVLPYVEPAVVAEQEPVKRPLITRRGFV